MTALKQTSFQALNNKHKVATIWLGNHFVVGIVDPDQASALMKSAYDKDLIHRFIKHMLGNGSVFAPANIWHRRRKILVPTFASRFVNKFVTVFEAHCKVMADLLESRVGKGDFSCYDYINHCTLDTVCETLFGVNLDVQNQPDHPFFNAFTQTFKNIAARVCQPWLHIDAIYKMLPIHAEHMSLVKNICDFVDDLIRKKTSIMEGGDENIKGDDKPKLKHQTFLELMIESSKDNDKIYSYEELREETMVLAMAGSDTSSVGTSFTLLMLAHHQNIQERVYKEIQEVLGDTDKPLQAEDLMKLKYTTAVIKETLRLYPPAPYITRHCKSNVELPSGIVLPAGCEVVISIWGIHRDPEHWGEDADEFKPDRFMDVPTPKAFFAFSHGTRNCIGQHYGMLLMLTLLVTTLRRYRFIPATNSEYNERKSLRVSFDLMLKHVNNFSLQVEHRNA